jgi:ketosteroid isomerase-like protein
MSQENVEVVRQALEATSGGDPDGGQAFFDPSIEWDMSGVPEWPEKSVYRGAEVREFLRSWAGSWQGWRFDVTEVRDAAGDLVFAGIHEAGNRHPERGERRSIPVTSSSRCDRAASRGCRRSAPAPTPSRPPGCVSGGRGCRRRMWRTLAGALRF